MKVIILVTMVAAFAAGTPSFMEEWNAFKIKYGKSYDSIEEEQRRMAIFSEKLKIIKENNAKYEAGLSSHTLVINRFTDKSSEEMSCFRSSGTEKFSKLPRFSYVPPAKDLPNSVDWREKGAVTPVKDQLQCESCWAFSTTGAMEGQLYMKTNKLVSLSEQQLMDCSQDYGNNGCMGGGLMDSAFTYLEHVEGLESEGSYPYENQEDTCRYKADQVVNGTKVKGYTDIPSGDDEALKSAVATIGPISIAISAGNEFQHYGKGIFKKTECDSLEINHGVLLVGYGTDNGDDFWLIKNSWGTKEWGENGYMRLTRARKNPCHISSNASYPILE